MCEGRWCVTICHTNSFVDQVFGSRVRVDGVAKVAELELAEKEKMKEKVDRILSHNPSVFINRSVCVLLVDVQFFKSSAH